MPTTSWDGYFPTPQPTPYPTLAPAIDQDATLIPGSALFPAPRRTDGTDLVLPPLIIE